MIKHITADEVNNNLNNKDVLIIDVRTPGEFIKGAIQGSINIPVTEIAEKISSVTTNVDKIIYLYCLSGSRSEMAAEILTDLGYKNSYSMSSGLLMWRAKKFELKS